MVRGSVWAFAVCMCLARFAAAAPLPDRRFELPSVAPTSPILLPPGSAMAELTVTAPPPLRTVETPARNSATDSTEVVTDETAFSDRVLHIAQLISRLQEREGAAFEALAERYAKLTQFTARLEQRDEAAFDERATRFARLIEFTKKLRVDQEARETEDFESKLDRALRAQALMQRLGRDRGELRIPVSNMLAPEPEEWIRETR
jgi:hypothetical protein